MSGFAEVYSNTFRCGVIWAKLQLQATSYHRLQPQHIFIYIKNEGDL
jgi:hypothetical protein